MKRMRYLPALLVGWLSLMGDGKALDARGGPFRVVVPGDKRPARWIRQVTTLKIVPVK